jgi:DNA polymerase-1
MLLSVHDEIVLEVPPEESEAVGAMVKQTMETIWELAVPLKVNMAVGDNWNEAH